MADTPTQSEETAIQRKAKSRSKSKAAAGTTQRAKTTKTGGRKANAPVSAEKGPSPSAAGSVTPAVPAETASTRKRPAKTVPNSAAATVLDKAAPRRGPKPKGASVAKTAKPSAGPSKKAAAPASAKAAAPKRPEAPKAASA